MNKHKNKTSYKTSYKMDRIIHELNILIEEIINYEIADIKVLGNAHVTSVVPSRDLSYCKVYVDVVVDNKKTVIDGLNNAKGYIRHIVAEQLDLKKTPEFNFVIDETIERAKHIEELLNKIRSEEKNKDTN